MNPWQLSASDLLIWGIVLHLIADWPLQNDWMSNHKASLKHPAAYVHASVHAFCLAFIFGWVALPLGVAHMLIDTRKPVVWWSRFIGQTQPENKSYYQRLSAIDSTEEIKIYDIGTEVRIWTDQVFHIVCLAVVVLLVA